MVAVTALSPEILAARQLVDRSERIVVLTGAGISTDSGIPDFRGPKGLWTKNPGAEKKAHIDNYINDPEHRRDRWQRLAEGSMWAEREPNSGHGALVRLEQRNKLHTLITQNVDGLHQAAGSSDEIVVEVHGTTRKVRCLDCGEEAPMEKALDRVRAGEADPACRTCGGLLKAATISFGQSLIADDLMRAELAARQCDLMMAVGTSLGVYPVAAVVPTAQRAGAKLLIVNAEPTPFDAGADIVLRGGISDVLPAIVEPVQSLPD